MKSLFTEINCQVLDRLKLLNFSFGLFYICKIETKGTLKGNTKFTRMHFVGPFISLNQVKVIKLTRISVQQDAYLPFSYRACYDTGMSVSDSARFVWWFAYAQDPVSLLGSYICFTTSLHTFDVFIAETCCYQSTANLLALLVALAPGIRSKIKGLKYVWGKYHWLTVSGA